MAMPPPATPSRPTDAQARGRGLATTFVIVGVCLAVALLASFVWPSPAPGSSSGGPAPVPPPAVDVTGPVGRIAGVIAGRNSGSTDPTEQLEDGSSIGRGLTGSLSGPIGGLEAARGSAVEVVGEVVATPRAALGGARATVVGAAGAARGTVTGAAGGAQATVAALRATPTAIRR